MTNTDREELMRYSTGSLIKASFSKLFQKKSVRLTVSGVATVILTFTAEAGRAGSWWFYPPLSDLPLNQVLEFLVFTLLIMSITCFVSNIGKFGKRKFIIAASVSAVLLCGARAFWGVLSGVDPSLTPFFSDEFWRLTYNVALSYIPMFLLALAVVLIVRLLLGRKKQA